MLALFVLLGFAAWIGHAALWVGFVNRVHATGMPRWMVKVLTLCGHAINSLAPLALAGWWWRSGASLESWRERIAGNGFLGIYLIACWAMAVFTLGVWFRRRFFSKSPVTLRSVRATVLDVGKQLGYKPLSGCKARLYAYVPGNQVLKIAVQELELEIERLPAALDGLSIAHLSDLHITGRIGKEFFLAAFQQVNQLRPDAIVLTGDLVDEIELLDWLTSAVAELAAPLGVYFVLGNHDMYTGAATRIREALGEAGAVDLGGRWKRLEVQGSEIIFAGNELPWFVPAADMEHCPGRAVDRGQLRVLLSHSPDQLPWAQRWDFDLMLAGHTHGGQIQLPVVGPIFAPSWQGVKHASGTFYAQPTMMHVSRGVSSELPLRLNCPPELTKLILRATLSPA